MSALLSPWVLGLFILLAGSIAYRALLQLGWTPQFYWPRAQHLPLPAPSDALSHVEPPLMDYFDPHRSIHHHMTPELTLRLLRVAHHGDGITFLFVNAGRAVMNLSLKGCEEPDACIEPRDLLREKQTGHITVKPLPPPHATHIDFTIRYEDWKGRPCHAEYRYSVADKTWTSERDFVRWASA